MIGMLISSSPYIFVTVLAFAAFGWCTGKVFTDKAGSVDAGFPEILGSGITVNILIYNIIALAGSLFGMKLWISSFLWIVCELAAAVYAVRKSGRGLFKVSCNKAESGMAKADKTDVRSSGWHLVLKSAVIILIVLQVFGTYMYVSEAPEVMIVTQNAVKAADTGRVVTGAPMMSLWAAVSKLLLRNPVIVIFSVSQFVMIPAFYLVSLMLARELSDKKDEQWFMMLCICILNLWGYQSKYMLQYTMLYCWFTGGTFVFYGLLPLMLWILLKKSRVIVLLFSGINGRNDTGPAPDGIRDIKDGTDAINDYYTEEDEDMKNHRIINARTVAIALLIVVIMLVGSVYVMNRKINSLYDATVNLQQQVNEGTRIYEFVPSDSQETVAYILRQADGGLTVIGSGKASYGEELYDLISLYSSEVNAWYLRNDKEEDAGAYNECIKKGLEVRHTYYINVEEKK